MGKRLKNIITENDFSKSYSVEEAVDIAIKTATTKFNETIDICMNLILTLRMASKMFEARSSFQKV